MDVLLVCMPFGPVFSPSYGLSLLKAGLSQRGIAARILYLTIPFAERIGQAFYSGLATEGRPSNRDLAGEWVFAPAVFPVDPAKAERYVQQVLLRGSDAPEARLEPPATPALVRRLIEARAQVPAFLEWCLEEVGKQRPRIVGFTSVFQQHVASLALARRLKERWPQTFIVFGGANCEGPMGAETLRQFACVDAALSGEADLVFPDLVERVLAGDGVEGLPGVRTQASAPRDLATGRFSSGPMVPALDALPYADFDDYFEQFEASRYARDWQPSVFFETSRGCWWGERQHCTFCGLNGGSMTFRSKSAARALDELTDVVKRHPGCDIQVVDNILDLSYFRDLLPELAQRQLDVTLFYETKSNLRKDQIRLLRDAGIRRIQPGIESLSDAVLKLMRKGVSALHNIQLLKWCKELGVEPHWNLLWGFAGEPPEEYARMARLVPLLTHLQPPTGYGGVRIDRFSPNFFDAERLGFANVRPTEPYGLVYDLPEDALRNLAYYFTYEYRAPQDVAAYSRDLARAVDTWKRAWDASDLFFEDTGSELLLWDLRPAARSALTLLRGVDRLLYGACDSASSTQQIRKRLGAAGVDLPPPEIEERLEPLRDAGLVVSDGPRHLSLAVRLGDYVPSAAATRRFRATARALGRPTRGGALVPLDSGFLMQERACFPPSPQPRPRSGGRTTPRGSRRPRFALRPRGVLEIQWGRG